MDADSVPSSYGAALGQLILKKRRAAGLTQTQLSEDAFGTASKTRRIHELENGTVANPHPKTIDPIIVTLNITAAELEACSEASGHEPDPELDRAYREARNLIEAAARQFEHSNPDASLAQLEDYLRAKAREWRQLRQRIEAIESAERARDDLREAATSALAAGEFERVDDLLAEAEEAQLKDRTLHEIERQAEIRITRGDACLFREDAEGAFEFYRTAAHFFDPFAPERTADMLSYLAGRVYEISLRSLSPRFGIARKLLDELTELPVVRDDRVELGIANYRRGLLYRNEAVGRHDKVDEELLRKALAFDRLAVENIEGAEVLDIAVSARISLGICLMEIAKLEPHAGHLDQAAESLRNARVLAEEEAPQLTGYVSQNLGAVYMAMRLTAEEPERLQYLKRAFGEFDRAIREAETHCVTDVWGAAHQNCARVLVEQVALSEMNPKDERFAHMRALAHYNAAIESYPITLFPDRFAEANVELAGVLGAMGESAPSPFADGYFQRALNAYTAAIMFYTKDHHPRRWADIHMRVGALFGNRGSMLDGDERAQYLTQAQTCFKAAAEVFTAQNDMQRAAACKKAASRVKSQLKKESQAKQDHGEELR